MPTRGFFGERGNWLKYLKLLVPQTGLEPVTPSLRMTELLRQFVESVFESPSLQRFQLPGFSRPVEVQHDCDGRSILTGIVCEVLVLSGSFKLKEEKRKAPKEPIDFEARRFWSSIR
jgi:hypothetical protein